MFNSDFDVMRRYISILYAVLLAAGCDLEEHPDYFVDRNRYFSNEAQCRSALDAVYIPLEAIYCYDMAVATEVCTDTGLNWVTTTDACLDVSPAFPRFGATVWEKGYLGVMYCNYAIEGIKKAPVDEWVKRGLLAEGYIMRGLYYHILTSFFGDVPWYEDDVDSKQVQREIQKLPRTDKALVRQYSIERIMEHIDALPAVRAVEVDGYRAGKALGYMLIGKMAMWNASAAEDDANADPWWHTASSALEQVHRIYGENILSYPVEDNIMWSDKNTPESIFEIQHTYSAGGLNYTSNIAGLYQPTHKTGTDLFDEYIYKSEGKSDTLSVKSEFLGDECAAWNQMRPTTYFCRTLQTYYGKDKRAKYNLAWDHEGQPFPSAYAKNPDGSLKAPYRAWVGKKLWCPGMKITYDHNNYKIFRYADAVLMLSECYAELEKYDKAKELLNSVKARAGIGDYTGGNEGLLEELRAERARELFGECHRKFDLVRWGIWMEAVEKHGELSGRPMLKENIRPCHEYYPIPDIQVGLSGGMLNNDEYRRYGL